MSLSRFATLSLACLVASACTVVVRQPEDQPEPRVSQPPRSTAATLGIPPGHLPPPGSCRVWIQGRPPGRQARSRTCHGILETAPVGAWILYRPAPSPRHIRVRYLHRSRPRVIVAIRVYDAETGAYLRDLALGDDDDNMREVDRRTPERRSPDDVSDDLRRMKPDQPKDRPDPPGNADDRSRRRASDPPPARADSARTPGNGRDPQRREADEGNRGGGRGVGGNPPDQAGPDRNNRRTDPPGRGNQGNDRADRGNQGNQGNNQADRGNRGNQGNDQADRGNRGNQRNDRADRGNQGNQGNNQAGNQGNDRSEAEQPRGGEQRGNAGGGGEANDAPQRASASSLGIDRNLFPRRGQCRIWIPGQPAEQQAAPANCNRITAPAGAWILRIPRNERNVIYVDYVDDTRPGVVVRTSVFDARTGAYLRDGKAIRH